MVPRHLFSQTDAAARLARLNNYEAAINRVSQQQQIHSTILKSIIAVESSGNPLAGIERTTGAKGLMQIIDQTWRNTIQRFPNVFFQNQPLTKFINREENNNWQNPELNILVGALAIRLKAATLSRSLGKSVSTSDGNDMVLVFTSYNAGEFTTAEAYNNAKKNGSNQPWFDLLMPENLEPAIQTVVERFKLGWNVGKKYDEISEYAGKVFGFMDLVQQQQAGILNSATTKNPTIQNDPNANSNSHIKTPVNTNSNNNQNNSTPQANNSNTVVNNATNIIPAIYIVVAGDTGAAIARKLTVTFDALQRANPNAVWSRLSIGQKINIPANNTATNNNNQNNKNSRAPRTHIIKRGDNIGSLAIMYKTTENALKIANPTKLKRWGDVEGFSVGDTIIIP